jgi:3-oxoacyl-[acyl-carrier protein] reductase|tara:strand:+ start:7117 stop:7908 length:792 start_codon:yes stop_codon:yes gene_type:complete
MFGDLSGKVAIVTGSGQGIGEGIAKVFASHGAKVVVATRSSGNGQQTVDNIIEAGGHARLVLCDVGQHSAINDMVKETLLAYDRVDIAVHNAAIYPLHKVDELNDEILDQTLSVNMKAAFWLTQACVPHFREHNWGRLIFTSSVTGPRVAMPGTAHYAMSKGGMNAFIRTAALEYARDNITVNGVEPGYIRTAAMSELADEDGLQAMADCIPLGHLGVPGDIAYAMLYLASEEASYLTGQTIVVDGGSTLPESQVVMDGFYNE